jgi:cell division protein FtsL
MSTAPKMLHVPMGPAPLREPLDRPRPRPRAVPAPSPRTGARRANARARRRTPFLLFSGLIVGGLVVALVSAQALVAQSSFRTEELSARIDALQRERGQLKLAVAELRSPKRLHDAAREQGLVLPDEIHLIKVSLEEGVSGPGSGAGKAPAPNAPDEQGALGNGP